MLTGADPALLEHFASLGESAPIELVMARDQAFSRYGEVDHLVVGTGRCTVAVDPMSRDETGKPLGLLGDLVFEDDPDALDALLGPAFEWFRQRGCAKVRGPITRHTWYPFRLVTEGFASHPRLSGEPWNAEYFGPRLGEAGFRPVAWYVSTWSRDQSRMQIERSQTKVDRLRQAGYVVRPFDPSRAPSELARLHQVTHAAFSAPFNYLFRPIDVAEMRLALGPSLGALDPRLLLLCETSQGSPAGFVYVTREGADVASIKTLAVSRDHAGAGIGGAIVAMAHQVCQALGLRRVAHTLMRVGGPSTAISDTGGHEVFRRYEILERSL